MPYKIKRYYKKKVSDGWLIYAEVYKINIWGSIKDILQKELTRTMKVPEIQVRTRFYSTSMRQMMRQLPCKEKEADRIIELLNAWK